MPFSKAICLFGLALLLAGCRSADAERRVQKVDQPATNKPAIRPVDTLNGRVIAVRDSLRFVIVDFAGGRMPKLDQHLNVYRLDQKVAEIKISGPYLETTVAADVTAGEALEGDLVRDR